MRNAEHPAKTPPRAPSQSAWDAMTAEERERVVLSLPGEVTDAEMSPPEGDLHLATKIAALDVLRRFLGRGGRRVYVASELPVYYPDEPRFAPDLLVSWDVEDRVRTRYIVSAEGKGLDFVMEVHVGGDRKKEAERNVERYARLGIPEYVVYDAGRRRITLHRLAENARTYVPVVPQGGRYRSQVLGLDLAVEEERLRFYAANAILLDSAELVARLESAVEGLEARVAEEARLRAEEARLRAEEARLRAEEARAREAAEAKVAALEAELARLRAKA